MVITNRAADFTSQAFKDYCSEQGIQNRTDRAHSPNGNPMLTKLSLNNPDQWCKSLNNVQNCLKNYLNRSTKVSPFRLLRFKCIEKKVIKELETERERIRKTDMKNTQAILMKKWCASFEYERMSKTTGKTPPTFKGKNQSRDLLNQMILTKSCT